MRAGFHRVYNWVECPKCGIEIRASKPRLCQSCQRTADRNKKSYSEWVKSGGKPKEL